MWRGAVEKAATERQRRDLGLFVCSLLCAYLFDTFFKSGAVKIFRHLARKMKDGKEELVGRTGLSWSFSYLLLKFQVLVPRVSTLVSLSFLSQSSDVFFFFVFTNSLLSKMQLLRRSSKCLMRVVCRCSLAERDGAVVAEPNRPLFQLSPAGAAAGRAGRDDGREAAAGGTL